MQDVLEFDSLAGNQGFEIEKALISNEQGMQLDDLQEHNAQSVTKSHKRLKN